MPAGTEESLFTGRENQKDRALPQQWVCISHTVLAYLYELHIIYL
jgi:hypothetical protein